MDVNRTIWHLRIPCKSRGIGRILAIGLSFGALLMTLSPAAMAGTGTVPDPPTLLGVTPGDGIVTLHMQRPTNTGNAGELYYNAFCYFISNGMPSGFVGFSFTDNVPVTGQTNGQAVRCRANIVNDLGPSDPSGYSDPVTPGRVPSAPAGTVVSIGNGSATVTFDPGTTDPATPIIDAEFRCMPGDLVAVATGSPITLSGLTNDTLYDCTVRSRNAVGLSPAASVAVIPTATPVADLAVFVTNDTDFVTGGGVTEYTVAVMNHGPAGAAGITLEASSEPLLTSLSWTCVAEGVARCPAAGTGPLGASLVLGVGGVVTFTVSADWPALPEEPVSYTALATVPTGFTDPVPTNNLATDGPDQRGVFRSGFD